METLPAYLAGSVPIATAVAGSALVGACVLVAANHRALLVLAAWTTVPPVLCAVMFPVVHLFLARYLLFTVPAWCLLAGTGLYAVSRAVSLRAEFRWTQVILAVPMAAVIAWISIPGQMEVRRVAPAARRTAAASSCSPPRRPTWCRRCEPGPEHE